MNRIVATVTGDDIEVDKFNRNEEEQINGQNPRTIAAVLDVPPMAKCVEIPESELGKWKTYSTLEQSINQHRLHAGLSSDVIISRNDCTLVSRSKSKVPATEISDWYECRDCGCIFEMPVRKSLTQCQQCVGPVDLIAEPFQCTSFSPYIGNGAEQESYEGSYTTSKNMEDTAIRDLFSDPNSGFQRGGTGYLRTPSDAPRNNRADAPGWFSDRGLFIRTLRRSRAKRAEQILGGFYLQGETDAQLASHVGWTKDAIKKERQTLLRRAAAFFRTLVKHPPCRAVDEKRVVA